MSYSFNYPCWTCENQFQCMDKENILNGINKIYEDLTTHMGSGEILLMCTKLVQKNKEKN